eukprot:2971854-Pleurochrysis_carterae.AAC.2
MPCETTLWPAGLGKRAADAAADDAAAAQTRWRLLIGYLITRICDDVAQLRRARTRLGKSAMLRWCVAAGNHPLPSLPQPL